MTNDIFHDEGVEPLSAKEIAHARALLAKLELQYPFNSEEIESLKKVIEIFERHALEIAAVIKEQQVKRLWAEVRLQLLSVTKWALAAFLGIVSAVQGWQVLSPLFKGWLGK